uniref:Lipocalin n=1 Tax=Peromyscus maniculatus bairdii TaxID=230844 RepID=A0A8C8UMA8_PERMB
MKVLLLAALACLVSATEEPLPFSGNFTTIYLASKIDSVTKENSDFRMLMREVKFFKNYTLMSMTFYVSKNRKCQLHTVWADKFPYLFCFKICEYLWFRSGGII